MRKIVIVVALAALCLLGFGQPASATPDPATQIGATTSSTLVPLSDDEMSHVVGGQINIPPGQVEPPNPPLSGYIKSLVDQYGVPPGQVGGSNGLANYIRSQFPTSSPGLGQLFH